MKKIGHMQLAYSKVSKFNLFLLMAGPGLYALQLFTRFAFSSMESRQIIDLVYCSCVVLFGLFLFKISRNSITKNISWFTLIFVILNTLSIINGFSSVFDIFYANLVLIIMPSFIAIILLRKASELYLQSFVTYFVLPLLFINFSTAFIEMSLRGANTFSSLQITGRSYELIALSILSLLLVSRSALRFRVDLFIGYALTTLMSFSRGALLSLSLVVFANAATRFKTFVKYIFILLLLLIFLTQLGFTGEALDKYFGTNLYSFWLRRVGIDAIGNLDIGFLDALKERQSIVESCLSGININPFLGTGVGGVQSFFYEHYKGIGFSGCHNFFVTPFLERGIFGGLMLIGLVFFSIINVLRFSIRSGDMNPIFLITAFLVFAFTTGVNFSIFSDAIRNANVFMTFLILPYYFLNKVHDNGN